MTKPNIRGFSTTMCYIIQHYLSNSDLCDWFTSICLMYLCACSEQPIFTTRVHVFQIDPDTKKKWLPVSSQPVPVSFYHDTARSSYRIISLDGSKVCSCLLLHVAVQSMIFVIAVLSVCHTHRLL